MDFMELNTTERFQEQSAEVKDLKRKYSQQ
jgi:hypothetical protein